MPDESFIDATDPFALFDVWFADAKATEPDVPNAMQLATVDASGLPTLRTVLLKGHSPEGLTFFTNLGSRKGRDLEANPHAALLFHWKIVKRQVIARGRVEPVLPAEADAYWATRPRESQLAAWASQQSRPLADIPTWDRGLADVTRRFEGKEIPRPPFWSGFRLRPIGVEFWQDGEFRRHTRLAFSRDAPTGAWSKTLLYP